MKKIQKKKTLRRIAFFSLSVVVVLSNADENDSPRRKLFLSLSLSKYRGKERPPRNDVLNNNNNNSSKKKLSLSSLSSLSLSRLFFENNVMNASMVDRETQLRVVKIVR